jgi:hypothetical protein
MNTVEEITMAVTETLEQIAASIIGRRILIKFAEEKLGMVDKEHDDMMKKIMSETDAKIKVLFE